MRPPFAVESHYKQGFADEMPDDEWLTIVGKKGWIVLSHDAKFHREAPALEAIRQHKVACFYLWGAQVPVWNKVGHLTAVYPKIRNVTNREKRPYIYRATENNRLLLVRHWDGRKEPKKYVNAAPKVPEGGARA